MQESSDKSAIVDIQVISPLIPRASRTTKSPRRAGGLPTCVFVGSGAKLGEIGGETRRENKDEAPNQALSSPF